MAEMEDDDHRREKDRGGGGGSGGKKKSVSRKRSHRDDDDEYDRRRDRDRGRDERDRGRRRKRKHHHHDRVRDDGASSSSSSSSSSDEERKRKKRRRDDGDRRKKNRRKEEKRRKKDRKKKDKKRKSKKHKRGSRASSSRRSRSQSRSRSRSSSRRSNSSGRVANETTRQDDPLRRNHEFASALKSLLSSHPKLSTELPIILIRMAGGTTFNLSSMPDASAARGLAQVFATLGQYGVKLDHSGSWMWDDGSGGGGAIRRPGTELVLLKLARSLLDGIGITAEAASGYEDRKKREQEAIAAAAAAAAAAAEAEAEANERLRRIDAAEVEAATSEPVLEEREDGSADRARLATRSLLAKFEENANSDRKGNGEASDATTTAAQSSLPSELGGIANLILEGESIVLDGIPDNELRSDLEQLFLTLGLVKTEMEDSDDEDEDEDCNEGPSMGYVLPDSGDTLARANVVAVLDECRGIQSGSCSSAAATAAAGKESGGAAKKRVIGPAMGPPPGFSASQALQEYAAAPSPDDTDDDDDEGPAPIGSEMAKRRQHIGQSISADAVRIMAEHRQMELADVAAGGTGIPSAAAAGGREEWMLTPGKHDFLKGIKSADPCKNRKFKNEKARGGGGRNAGAADVGPQLTAEQQAEVDTIRRRVDEARGPTLIEQHRQKKAEEKEVARKSGKDRDFKWNRDRDLDAGRRVDKDHLHMVLGGAKEGLKDKFHGSFSRGM